MQWFSEPQETIEAAQALHQPGVLAFDPAAVFKTKEGKFIMVLLRRNGDWPPHDEAQNIERLTGNVMVSCCDPLFGIWKPYTPAVVTE